MSNRVLTIAGLLGLAITVGAVAAPNNQAPSQPSASAGVVVGVTSSQPPSTKAERGGTSTQRPSSPKTETHEPQLPPGEVLLPPATPLESGDSNATSPTAPEALTHYAVLMDVTSGKILWSRNPNSHREIASTTKIMTAILLLERGKPGAIVVAPKGIDKIEESSLHLTPGETIPLHDMLYAMMLRSANDTAVAGAVYLSGSVPAFAAEMNKKAREIGAMNTNFVTPNGLYNPNHYSTAADLGLIARYAVLNIPEFNTIVSTQNYKVQRSMHTGDVWVKNTASKFLKEFPGADGIKTGYISQAGHCFVGSATRHDWRLIAVALDSYKCREDVESILNYGFANFRRVNVMSRDDAVGQVNVPSAVLPVPVKASADVVTAVSRWKSAPRFSFRLIPLPVLPRAPIAVGTRLGTVKIMSGGTVQATVDAIATQAVAAKPLAIGLPKIGSTGSGFLQAAARVLGAVILMILGGRIYARTVAKGSGGSRDRVASKLRRVN